MRLPTPLTRSFWLTSSLLRQLLCLARALLRNRKLLVLDECTSSMDHLTDEKIRHVVATQCRGTTVISGSSYSSISHERVGLEADVLPDQSSVAHRIASIVTFDRVLVLDGGEVAEFDDPQNLLRDKSSRFARLAATQGIYAAEDGGLVVEEDMAVDEKAKESQ